MHRCSGHINPDQAREMQEFIEQQRTRSRATATDDERLYCNVIYRVLWNTASENLSLNLLKSQHQQLNACFNLINPRAAYVPTSGNYAHPKGNPNMVFLPTNYNDLTEAHVERIQVGRTSFSSLSDALNYLTSQGLVTAHNDKFNIIVATLDGFLGEATLVGNSCVILNSSIGGELIQGKATPYVLGITLVHELGHNLGLPHTFTGSGTCEVLVSDVPSQKNPNYGFTLFQETDGSWNGRLCNRYRDCAYYRNGDNSVLTNESPPYSCNDCSTNSGCNCEGLHEAAACFMDYGSDFNIVMFTPAQSVIMRSALISGATGVTLKDWDGGELIAVDAATTMNTTDDNAGDLTDKQTKKGLSDAAIIAIVVGSVIGFALMFLLIWFLAH